MKNTPIAAATASISTIWQVGLLMLLALCITPTAYGQDKSPTALKKRIAIFKLDDKTDQRVGWWDQKSIGDGIADMIVTELVKSGKYKVLERQNINQLLKEQDLARDGIVRAESAAKVGQMLGAELIVTGAITEFGYRKSDTNVGALGKRVGVGTQSAVCAIDLRLVNSTTGEIASADNIRRSKTTPSGSFSGKNLEFSNQQSFDESLVGKVSRQVVQDVVDKINEQMANVSWSAKIIMEKGGQIFLNSGANDGVTAGMRLKVFRQGEALVDPDTGLTLGSVEEEIGEIEVENPKHSDGKVSICKSTRPGLKVAKGDVARLKQ